MKTMGIRFGEAFKVKISQPPPQQPVERKMVVLGHDGIGFEPEFEPAPELSYGNKNWRAMEQKLAPQAGLVSAIDPKTKRKETYVVTKGPAEDTFQRMSQLKTRIQQIVGTQNADHTRSVLSVMLPMEGIIQGNEPEVTLRHDLGNWDEVAQKMQIKQESSLPK